MGYVFDAGKMSTGSGKDSWTIGGPPIGKKKIPVAVLGACGSVGQRLVEMTCRHPWFDLVQVCSDTMSGQSYGSVTNWVLPSPMPEKVRAMTVSSSEVPSEVRMAFSVQSAVGDVETAWAKKGIAVITNSAFHRANPLVPLIVPEVNLEQFSMIAQQPFPVGGMIIATPSCAGLTMALYPLLQAFGIEKVFVTSYLGADNESSLDNIVPSSADEDHAYEQQLLKILSTSINVSSARVPITEGKLDSVSVSLTKKASFDDVKKVFSSFLPQSVKLGLPLSPRRPLHFFDQKNAPQPRLHRSLDGGMGVSVGSLRACHLLDYMFFVLSHSSIREAAGGIVLLGEYLVKEGKIS